MGNLKIWHPESKDRANDRWRETKRSFEVLDLRIWKNVVPRYSNFQKGVIHGDLNEQNVLVKDGNISGIIDFSDLNESYKVFDIGISLFYFVYDKSEYV